jgi:small subunit ribosomal protein S33
MATAVAAAPTASRLGALKALQCALFQTAYNPTSARTGAKYLRARLRGPALVRYYPKTLRLADLRKTKLGAEFLADEGEEQRIQDVEDKKARGKGPPPKTKEKGERVRAVPVRCQLTGCPTPRRESACEPQTVDELLWRCALCYSVLIPHPNHPAMRAQPAA